MNNGKANFFDNGVVYNLNYLKWWVPESEKNEKTDDSSCFPCIPCMARQGLFKFLKTSYNDVFNSWSKILEKNGCEATDINVGNGVERNNLSDEFPPLDRFYLSANFTGKYHGEVKTALYIDPMETDSLVISSSVDATLKLKFNDDYKPTLSKLRKMFWQVSGVTNTVVASVLKKNKLLKENQGGYLLESLIASSSKLDGDLIKKISKKELRKEVATETQEHARSGWILLDELTARNRRFKKTHFVLEQMFGKNAHTVTYFGLKRNDKCAVFVGVSDNPPEFNKSLKFNVINTSLRLN